MATSQALLDDVRSRIVESTAAYFSDAEILRWLNQGYKRFISQTEWAERVTAYPMVANQHEYAIASDVIKVCDMRWQDKYKVWLKDLEEFNMAVGPGTSSIGTRPEIYRLYPWDGKFRLHPRPSTASAATTLNGGINSSDTTITVVSAADFPSYGRVKIESEQILYYAKTSTTLLQCVRGDGTTTAASHSTAVAVTYAPLEVYNVYMPADLATSPAVGTVTSPNYDEAIINYACHVAMLKRERFDNAQLFRQLYDDIVSTAIQERRKMQLDRLFTFKDEDLYGHMY